MLRNSAESNLFVELIEFQISYSSHCVLSCLYLYTIVGLKLYCTIDHFCRISMCMSNSVNSCQGEVGNPYQRTTISSKYNKHFRCIINFVFYIQIDLLCQKQIWFFIQIRKIITTFSSVLRYNRDRSLLSQWVCLISGFTTSLITKLHVGHAQPPQIWKGTLLIQYGILRDNITYIYDV